MANAEDGVFTCAGAVAVTSNAPPGSDDFGVYVLVRDESHSLADSCNADSLRSSTETMKLPASASPGLTSRTCDFGGCISGVHVHFGTPRPLPTMGAGTTAACGIAVVSASGDRDFGPDPWPRFDCTDAACKGCVADAAGAVERRKMGAV